MYDEDFEDEDEFEDEFEDDDDEDDLDGRLANIETVLAGQGPPGVTVSQEDAELLLEAYQANEDEAEWLDAVGAEIDTIEHQIGRELSAIEIEGIVDRVEETGEAPTEFAGDGYIADLSNAHDRTQIMADYMTTEAEEQQEAAESEPAEGLEDLAVHDE